MTIPALKALLLDLDDTLIDNPMDTFIPAYFKALETFVAGTVPPDLFIAELLAATRAMNGNDGTGVSNEDVFSDAFYRGVGMPRAELEPVLESFYAEAFPALRQFTSPRPAAPKIVEWARDRGLQVVIATNPLFPRSAIEQRMEWGRLGVDRFTYDLVTTYENSHATKSQPAYYREILQVLGRRPEDCLMVGDNWDWDVVCAAEVGIKGFWIATQGQSPPPSSVEPVGQGSLDDFLSLAESGALEQRMARSKSGRVAR